MTRSPWFARVLIATPLAVLAAFVATVAVSLTGWSNEPSPFGQLASDSVAIATLFLAGGTCGGLIGWAIRAHRVWVTSGTVIGLLPAVVMVAAYFTDAY